jgi:hypothetical protein
MSWESMSLREQMAHNLRAFVGLHQMQISADWPATRIEATLKAERRIRRYALRRVHRMKLYAHGDATQTYRRRWWPSRLVVVDPTRFSRAFGGGGR